MAMSIFLSAVADGASICGFSVDDYGELDTKRDEPGSQQVRSAQAAIAGGSCDYGDLARQQ